MTILQRFKKAAKEEAEKAGHKMSKFFYNTYSKDYESFCEYCGEHIFISMGKVLTEGNDLSNERYVVTGKALTNFNNCKGKI